MKRKETVTPPTRSDAQPVPHKERMRNLAVTIEGMELPQACGRCPLGHPVDSTEEIVCMVTGRPAPRENDARPPWCPLRLKEMRETSWVCS